MVIAFYPGGGGNRYLQMLLGNSWTKLKTSYDTTNRQKYEYRYLLETMPAPSYGNVLTHCMNRKKIIKELQCSEITFIKTNLQQSLKREWLLHGYKIYMDKKINNNISKLDHYQAFKDHQWPDVNTIEQLESLPEHILNEVNSDYNKITIPAVPGQLLQITQECINKINSAYETIVWHRDYYQRFPVDFSTADTVIDVETSNDEFSIFMRQELSLYQSEIFDSVWDKIYNG